MRRNGKHSQTKHHVRGRDSRESSYHLRHNISGSLTPSNPAQPRIRQRHSRVQVRPGDRPKPKDDRDQRRSCCQRIRQQSDCNITRRKTFSHDPRPHHGSKEQQRPRKLRNDAAQQSGLHKRPIFSIS